MNDNNKEQIESQIESEIEPQIELEIEPEPEPEPEPEQLNKSYEEDEQLGGGRWIKPIQPRSSSISC